MDNTEQTTDNPEQALTPSEETQAEQTQSEGGGEAELTEEQQQAEVTKKTEEVHAAERQSAYDKRIAKLTREKYDAIREAEALREKYATQEQKAYVEPQLHDFESLDDYAKALSDFHKAKSVQDYQNQFEQERSTQIREAQVAKLQTAETEFTKLHPDFKQVLQTTLELSGGAISENISNALLEVAEDAPAVLYELAKDPVDYVELLGMSPINQLLKIGEVRATLRNKPKTPKIPNIPTPINPSKGGSNSKKDPYKGSDDEFLRSRGLK